MPPLKFLVPVAILLSPHLLAVAAMPEPVRGLKMPPGFTVTEFAGDEFAHDCYTLTFNPRSQVVVAGRGYLRTLIDDDGDGKADRAVEISDTPKDGAMGLLWEGDTLWAVGDGGLRRFQIGPDGKAVGPSELVYKLKTGGEHDAHALRRGPDGCLYWLCGNDTAVSSKDAGPLSPIRDPVAGAVLRLSPDLKTCEIVADGYRNPYGFDFNGDGELFTFDSDNERCIGLPWYEGCRLYHVIPGGHYGWLAPQRAAFWRLPPYFPDVVPPLADLGRGSPTGVVCYRHRQFPEKYRGGLFLGDWTFGRIYYAALTPSGSTYTAKVETFLEATGEGGFAPTGLAVHPTTGDLFVSVGGRGTRGAVYQIRYPDGLEEAAKGFAPTPAKKKQAKSPGANPERRDPAGLEMIRDWERKAGDFAARASTGTVFEGYTVRSPEIIPSVIVEELGTSFRTNKLVRPMDLEATRLLAIVADSDSARFAAVARRLTLTSDPLDDTHYLIVLARMTSPRAPAFTSRIADALLGLDRKLMDRGIPRDTNWPLRIAELHAELARRDRLLNGFLVEHPDLLRPGNLVFTRCPGFDRKRAAERYYERAKDNPNYPWTPELVGLMGELPAEKARPLLMALWDRGGFEDAILPVLARDSRPEDRDKFLAGLRSPHLDQATVCLKALARLPAGDPSNELLALVRLLRSLGDSKAEKPVRERVVERLEKLTGQTIGPDKVAWTAWLTKSHPDLAGKLGGEDGVDVAAWQKRFARIYWKSGDVDRGKAVFTKASCAACHSGTSAVGPDLRGVGGRFGREDLLTAIIQPSKDIAPRYRTLQIESKDGKIYQGVVVYEATDGVMLQTGPATMVRIPGHQIVSRGFNDKSFMPAGLLENLKDGEIADLIAYLQAFR
jgi:putative heme-binding domain-containing protein